MPPLFEDRRSAEKRVVSFRTRSEGETESFKKEKENSQSSSPFRLGRHQPDGTSERMAVFETCFDVPPDPVLPIAVLAATAILGRSEDLDEVEADERGSERRCKACSAMKSGCQRRLTKLTRARERTAEGEELRSDKEYLESRFANENHTGVGRLELADARLEGERRKRTISNKLLLPQQREATHQQRLLLCSHSHHPLLLLSRDSQLAAVAPQPRSDVPQLLPDSTEHSPPSSAARICATRTTWRARLARRSALRRTRSSDVDARTTTRADTASSSCSADVDGRGNGARRYNASLLPHMEDARLVVILVHAVDSRRRYAETAGELAVDDDPTVLFRSGDESVLMLLNRRGELGSVRGDGSVGGSGVVRRTGSEGGKSGEGGRKRGER